MIFAKHILRNLLPDYFLYELIHAMINSTKDPIEAMVRKRLRLFQRFSNNAR